MANELSYFRNKFKCSSTNLFTILYKKIIRGGLVLTFIIKFHYLIMFFGWPIFPNICPFIWRDLNLNETFQFSSQLKKVVCD